MDKREELELAGRCGDREQAKEVWAEKNRTPECVETAGENSREFSPAARRGEAHCELIAAFHPSQEVGR